VVLSICMIRSCSLKPISVIIRVWSFMLLAEWFVAYRECPFVSFSNLVGSDIKSIFRSSLQTCTRVYLRTQCGCTCSSLRY
jgi:hypothetical protein